MTQMKNIFGIKMFKIIIYFSKLFYEKTLKLFIYLYFIFIDSSIIITVHNIQSTACIQI
jgi:hypothetical protein